MLPPTKTFGHIGYHVKCKCLILVRFISSEKSVNKLNFLNWYTRDPTLWINPLELQRVYQWTQPYDNQSLLTNSHVGGYPETGTWLNYVKLNQLTSFLFELKVKTTLMTNKYSHEPGIHRNLYIYPGSYHWQTGKSPNSRSFI